MKEDPRQVLLDVLHKVEENCQAKVQFSGIQTGFKEIDEWTGGLLPGEITIIGGRPGVGKTSFALSILDNITQSNKYSCLFYSTDYSEHEIALRLFSLSSRIPLQKLRLGQLSDRDWARFAAPVDRLYRANLSLSQHKWLSLSVLRKKCEELANQNQKPDIIFIDKFYSLVLDQTPAEGANNRILEQFQIVVELKALAREVGATVVIMCDINKSMEGRQDKRPLLVDMRDNSGVLESYSDLVIFLYRDDCSQPFSDRNEGLCEAILVKNRRNKQSVVRLNFIGEYGLWSEFR